MAEWIKLDVGGQIFKTTRTTLLKDPESMLARMFSQDDHILAPAQSEDGAYLMDSSPEFFKPILHYLRRGELFLDANINPEGVLAEAKYYGLKDIIASLEKQIHGLEIHEESSRFILVIGGFHHIFGASVKVELLDLENQSSKTLADFPLKTLFPTGGLLMGQPVVCGGGDNPIAANDKCFKLEDAKWVQLDNTMQEKRSSASATVLPSKMWIHGGHNESSVFKSSELITIEGQVTAGPDLPKSLRGHVTIQVDDKIIVIGGDNGNYEDLRTTRIFQASDLSFVKDGPRLKQGRCYHGITTFSSSKHEGRNVIIVAGGTEAPTSVEIWDHSKPGSTWEEIRGLPKVMYHKPGLHPYDKGVMIIYDYSIYKLVVENNGYRYEKMPFSLQYPRHGFVSMAIPSKLAKTLLEN